MAVPEGSTYPAQQPARACLSCVWGCKAGCSGSPSVLCSMYPAVTAQEEAETCSPARRGLGPASWARRAESHRKVYVKKSLWLSRKSPVLRCHRCGGTGCHLSLHWHGQMQWSRCQHLSGEEQERHHTVIPFLHAPEKATPLLLKGKLLCSVPRFYSCL